MTESGEKQDPEVVPLIPIDTFPEVRNVLVKFTTNGMEKGELLQNLTWIEGLQADLKKLGVDVADRRGEYLERYGQKMVDKATDQAPVLARLASRIRNSIVSKSLDSRS